MVDETNHCNCNRLTMFGLVIIHLGLYSFLIKKGLRAPFGSLFCAQGLSMVMDIGLPKQKKVLFLAHSEGLVEH